MIAGPQEKDHFHGHMSDSNQVLGFLGDSLVKNSPANAGDRRDLGLIPGSGRFPRGRNSNSLQYSCLENPMDRGVWRAIVHGVAKESDMTEQLTKQQQSKIQFLLMEA